MWARILLYVIKDDCHSNNAIPNAKYSYSKLPLFCLSNIHPDLESHHLGVLELLPSSLVSSKNRDECTSNYIIQF